MYYYVTDHLGTPRVLTDQNQAVVWESNGQPFGKDDGGSNQIEQPLRFAGQYRDVESDLYYNWYRYYDRDLGRYITSDPIGLNGGLNTYAYVGSNPLKRVDPKGLYYQGSANSVEEAEEKYPGSNPYTPLSCEMKCNMGLGTTCGLGTSACGASGPLAAGVFLACRAEVAVVCKLICSNGD